MGAKPVYKIETYTGAVLDHTITSDASAIRVKKTLTSNVGSFSFTVPTKKNGGYYYDDIALNDKVKIWLGYDTISGNPVMVGKVYQISAPLTTESGYLRLIKGRDQGEILQRRFKGMKDWEAVGASTIVTELANDLSLGTGEIASDATQETHRIDIDKHERYWDFLKKVSDYWYDASTQVKKDFYVDESTNLVWKARPIRTVGVETFTVGDNIISYNVQRDLSNVKNKIHVYGAKLKAYDNDKDFGTEISPNPYLGSTVDQQSASGQKNLYVADTTDFSADDTIYIWYSDRIEENEVDSIVAGDHLVCKNNLANNYPVASGVIVYPGWGPVTASTDVDDDGAPNKIVGSVSIKVLGTDGGGWCGALYKPSTSLNLNYYPSINFYIMVNSAINGFVRYQDTSGNFASRVFSTIENDSEFHFITLNHGRDNEDSWKMDSGFDWTSVSTIEISMFDGTMWYWVDGLFLNHRRFSNTAEDATSQSNYGIRELVVVDDSLVSDSDCQKRGEALLYQQKDPTIRADLEVKGNTNVLIGDRLSLTFPAENISSASYDVVTVIHSLLPEPQGFRTVFNCVNSANVRQLPARTVDELLVQKFQTQREIGRGITILE